MTEPLPTPRYLRNFATTRWGVVRAAAGEDESARSALESLCKDYWEPVHAHILYRVSDTHLAEDLTQEFFSKFLSQGWFLRPRQDRGKFRTFLLVVLRRFLKDEFERTRTWKRGGRAVTMSIDELPEVVLAGDQPEATSHFDRAWAKTLLDRAFANLRRESDVERFDCFRPFLQREPEKGEYQELTERFGMTPNSIAAAVSRMRRRLRDLLREEIRQTLHESDDVEEEMRHLLHLLAA